MTLQVDSSRRRVESSGAAIDAADPISSLFIFWKLFSIFSIAADAIEDISEALLGFPFAV
jgi:hypothetical protein